MMHIYMYTQSVLALFHVPLYIYNSGTPHNPELQNGEECSANPRKKAKVAEKGHKKKKKRGK